MTRLSRDTRLALRLLALDMRLQGVLHRLERRYNPNQPRVPAGNPDGGEWTSTGGGGQGRNVGRTKKPVRTALAGVLILQKVGLGDDRLIRMCTYQDMFGRQYSKEQPANELCPPTLMVPPYYGPF